MSDEPLIPNGLSTELGARSIRFEVGEDIYPLDVIQGAAYLFVDRAYLFLDRPRDGRVTVVLKTRGPTDPEALEALAGEFANELLNQALRKNIGESNARIREFVMARAFFAADGPSTIDRLLAQLDEEELAEAPLDIAVPWQEPRNG